MCVHTSSLCVLMCIRVYGGSIPLRPHIFETGFLPNLRAHCLAGYTGRSMSSGNPLFSTGSSTPHLPHAQFGSQTHPTTSQFFSVGPGNPNPGAHVCEEGSLPTTPFPKPPTSNHYSHPQNSICAVNLFLSNKNIPHFNLMLKGIVRIPRI